MQQRIAIQANAGGVGKTTLAVNLAYQLARLGKSVALFGCDPNGSLALFCGLKDPEPDRTLDKVLRKGFDGGYPLFPVWPEKIDGIYAVLGGLILSETSERMSHAARGEYFLADVLMDHSLPHDFILFDCPGTIEKMHTLALAASTSVLVTLRPEDKDVDAIAKLFEWIFSKRVELRLNPKPEISGVVLNGTRERDRLMHRKTTEELPTILNHFNIPLLGKVPDNAYVSNASANGLPLGIYRPGSEINLVYQQVAQALVKGES